MSINSVLDGLRDRRWVERLSDVQPGFWKGGPVLGHSTKRRFEGVTSGTILKNDLVHYIASVA